MARLIRIQGFLDFFSFHTLIMGLITGNRQASWRIKGGGYFRKGLIVGAVRVLYRTWLAGIG